MTVPAVTGHVRGPARAGRSSVGHRLRKGAGTFFTYLLLSVIGVIIIFPFVFMLTTSLKTSEEVFRYPPRIMPMEAKTVVVEGQSDPVEVYQVALGDTTYEMIPVERGVRAGVFATAEDPATTTVWPLDQAIAVTDAEGAPVTAVVNGETVPLFDITIAGREQRLAKLRETSVAKLQVPGDPSIVSYAVLRTATPVESPTAHPENYSEVLRRSGFDRNLTNTIMITMFVVIGQLITSIMGGYAFARIRFPGRNALFLIYLGSIMIPFVVLIIPLYQLMVGIGWVDQIPALIFPWLFSAYGTFLMRQFFITLPKELEEAALIDGASRWTILWRIFVPLSMPAIATLVTFSFLYAWNSFVWPFIIISTGNTDSQVLTVALQQFGGRAADSPQLVFAGVAIAVAFPVALFVLLQRYFVENVSTSGIK
jgi:ABC-type glycerol-3-phosphate transport system permease component